MHSNKIGGSNAERIMACPASMNLHRKHPQTTSQYAERGTALHWAIEQELSGSPRVTTAPNGVEIEWGIIDQTLPLWAKVAAAVQFYLLEARVKFGAPLEGCFGTVDILAQDFVLDWKFGQGVPVSAIDNKQLLFYAAAARETYPDEFTGGDITLVIVQPPGFSTWTVPAQALDDFRLELVQALSLAESDSPPLNAGKHCRWCAHQPYCDEHKRLAMAPPADAELPELLELAEQMRDWSRSVFERAEQEMNRGGSIEGWKLVQKRAAKRWLPEAEFRRDLYTETMMSPAQALKRKLDIDNLYVSESSGTTLVRESDKRDAVNVNVHELLKGIQK